MQLQNLLNFATQNFKRVHGISEQINKQTLHAAVFC